MGTSVIATLKDHISKLVAVCASIITILGGVLVGNVYTSIIEYQAKEQATFQTLKGLFDDWQISQDPDEPDGVATENPVSATLQSSEAQKAGAGIGVSWLLWLVSSSLLKKKVSVAAQLQDASPTGTERMQLHEKLIIVCDNAVVMTAGQEQKREQIN